MSLPHHQNWRYFANKAAKENDSEELMKHVSHLLQLLGDEYPARLVLRTASETLPAPTRSGILGTFAEPHAII